MAAVGRTLGRYVLHGELAAGGMATVHLGRLMGPVGFSRTVAIKRLHPQYAKDPEFVSMFVDEARLAARIRHPNVVSTLDVVHEEGELFLVMDYVHGESLARIVKTVLSRGERIPPRISSAIMVNALNGLHAAHEARDESGAPLHVVHRDVSPQNVLVGADGIARVLDFGVAKAKGRIAQTKDGQIKGKIAYMAPEQFKEGEIGRAVDIYAAGVVLWETLAHKRLVVGDSEAAMVEKVLYGTFDPVTGWAPELPKEIDDVLAKAMARDANARFGSAREMAGAIEKVLGVASMNEVADWLETVAHTALQARAKLVTSIEAGTAQPPPSDVTRIRPVAEESTVANTALTAPTNVPMPQAADAMPTNAFAKKGRVGVVIAALVVVGVVALFLLARSPRAPTPTGTTTTNETSSAATPSSSAAPTAPPTLPAPTPTPAASETTSAAPSTTSTKPTSKPNKPIKPAKPPATATTSKPAGLPEVR